MTIIQIGPAERQVVVYSPQAMCNMCYSHLQIETDKENSRKRRIRGDIYLSMKWTVIFVMFANNYLPFTQECPNSCYSFLNH